MASSISGLYLVVTSWRRLSILAMLNTEHCLTIDEVAKRTGSGIPVILYEISLLEKNGLVESRGEAEVCITERGRDIMAKIMSIDQDLVRQAQQDSLTRLVDMLTLRGLAVLLKLLEKVTTPILTFTMLVALILLVSSGGCLLGLMPLNLRPSIGITLLSASALFIVLTCLNYFLTRRLALSEILLPYSALISLSLLSVPLRQLIEFALHAGLSGELLSSILILVECLKLALPVLGTALAANILSFTSGKTFENIFLILAVIIVIPSLVAYGALMYLQTTS